MNKKQKIAAHRELSEQLIQKETDILEEIIIQINEYYKEEEIRWDELFDTIINLIYISLKQTYKITLQKINEIYNLNIKIPKSISKKEIDKYVYSNDKLTLSKRVKQYINKAKNKEIDDSVLKFYITRILDNETLILNHKLTKVKLKENKVEYGMIVAGGGCDRDCCNNSIEEPMPIDEIEEPPYHPNCTCEIIYLDPELDDEKE